MSSHSSEWANNGTNTHISLREGMQCVCVRMWTKPALFISGEIERDCEQM